MSPYVNKMVRQGMMALVLFLGFMEWNLPVGAQANLDPVPFDSGSISLDPPPSYSGSPSPPAVSTPPNYTYPAPTSTYSGGYYSGYASSTYYTAPKPNIPFNPQSGDYFDMEGSDLAVWEQFPLKLYIDYPDKFPSNSRDQVQAAIQEWKRYVPMEITRESANAQIKIEWVSDLDGGHFGKTKIKGTEPSSSGRNRITGAEIKLLTPDRYNGLPDEALRMVVIHELGHAMGLPKNSDVDDDIMAEPDFQTVNKGKVVKQVVKSLALKGIEAALNTQGINLGLTRNLSKPVSPSAHILNQLSQRDLNTLYKLYNPQMSAGSPPPASMMPSSYNTYSPPPPTAYPTPAPF